MLPDEGAHFMGAGQHQGLLSELLTGDEVQLAHPRLDQRDAARRHAQLVNAQPHQHGYRQCIRGQFTANAHPLAVRMSGLDGHADQPQHRRVQAIGLP